MKHIFWILRKVDILVILKAPLGFKLVNCRPVADISSYCATLLTYTSIKKEKNICVWLYSPFYCLFWEKLHLSIKMSCTGLSKFFISLVLLNWGWLTFIQFFFLSKKDQLYDLIQLDILWKLKFKICIKMLV